ncbi:MAG: phenylalanine--tRNA ligase subunit beta [Bacteroidaceae bacterium]|nr:phenylalanine--tRNA ligase subunit beta [Bacteroidaceae bacterium]
MNISYKWLREYVDTTLTAQEVAAALTSAGLEVDGVEEVQSIRGGLEGLVVGHVLTCEPHPDSDHMHVCTVDVGGGTDGGPDGEPSGTVTQIVCGAPNVAAGQKVIVATLGTRLYDGDKEFVIKRSKLRGVESNGMICAEDEIGVGESHAGIIVLPEDTPVGMKAAEYYGLESDWLIEVDITANRADACSHYGVARDLYAWLVQNGYKTALHRPSVEDFKVDNHALQIPIHVENAEACPRYAAVTVTDCEVKESPKWLKDHLTTIGLRPINNIVDITNYIMMAFGQPLHCFDADMIKGGEVIVKTLPEGTPFQTLDGVEHKLSDRDLMICNAEEPMCIGGVYGGKGSGTYETTRNVLLESAYFNPTWIRKSSRRHGLQTDASFRFERGIDPNGQLYALKLAAKMCQELAGGKVSMEIVDVYPQPLPDFPVDLKYNYVDSLIGQHIPAETVKSIVTSLEMRIEEETAEGLKLMVPAYRVDVQRPCDVVEDILRIYGYNNIEIPSSLNSSLSVKGEVDKSHKLQNIVAEQLVGAGFNEILNNSLTKAAYYDNLQNYPAANCVRLLNPLSQDLSVLRQTLLFGGLESICRNVNRRRGDVQFFEFGNCYYFHQEKKSPVIIPGVSSSRDPEVIKHVLDAYSEDYHLGLWVTGKRVSGSWAHPDEDQTFYVLKAQVINVLARVGVPFGALVFKEGRNDIFSKSILIENRGGKVIAQMGIVAKRLQVAFDIPTEVYFADIAWQQVMRLISKQKVSYTELPKFPAVSRDLALLVDKSVEFAQIEAIAYQTERKLLKEVTLFDVYEGKNLPAGKKSYAVNFILQDETKTLNDRAIDAIMQKLIQNLTKQLGAELR